MLHVAVRDLAALPAVIQVLTATTGLRCHGMRKAAPSQSVLVAGLPRPLAGARSVHALGAAPVWLRALRAVRSEHSRGRR